MGYNDVLLTILLVLCSILVMFLIVVCIKLLYTTDKLNIILTDIEKKLKTVDGVFNVIDSITSTLTNVSDAVISRLATLLEKIFKKRIEEDKDNE